MAATGHLQSDDLQGKDGAVLGVDFDRLGDFAAGLRRVE